MNSETQLISTLSHIAVLGRGLDQNRVQQIVSAVLLELGTPTKQSGFDYLRRAVSIYRDNPTQLITKELYPAVARQYPGRVNSQQVERAIRTAIDYAFRNGSPETWNLYFPEAKAKPSNAAFISRLARLIDLCESGRGD